jgi:peptidoglycan/LPS O-acetylase OafA/YrhL
LRISLAFPLLLVFVRHAPTATLTAAFGLYAAERLGPPWLSHHVPDTATYIVYFAAGAWLALNRVRMVELARRTEASAKALLCALALLLLSVPTENPGAGISTGLGAVLLIGLVAACPAIADILSARWCVFLGRISYSLYLTHVVVLIGLGKVLGTSLSVPLILAVAAPMIGFVGWIGYRWMEQPSIRLGRTVEVCFARCCSARL